MCISHCEGFHQEDRAELCRPNQVPHRAPVAGLEEGVPPSWSPCHHSLLAVHGCSTAAAGFAVASVSFAAPAAARCASDWSSGQPGISVAAAAVVEAAGPGG